MGSDVFSPSFFFVRSEGVNSAAARPAACMLYCTEFMTLNATAHSAPRHLATIGLLGFFLLGLIYPILGPSLPRLGEQFGLRASGVSWLLSANSLGAFCGVILAGLLAGWLSPQQRSLTAAAVVAAGCLGLAFAPSFALALLAAAMLGVGFGMLDLTLNVWISGSYGHCGAAMLNLLSASFGVGAVLAPLAVGLADGNFQLPLLACGALAFALLLALLLLPTGTLPVAAASPAPVSTRSSYPLLGGFILFFMAYVAVESGVGAWEVTHLQATLGLATSTAAQLSALFWISFTVGRLISAPLALRVPPARLVTAALLLAAGSLALASVPSLAVLAYALTGLFLAPVFTTGLVWMTRVLPGSQAPTLVFAGAFLGPVLAAPMIGTLRDTFGSTAIPLSLLGITALALALLAGLRLKLRT
ncbi:MFS transporter [Deinococcus saxicola]|uniref:MFS transporter n=1 Tax=Deinococcus saxicola TaxID=249406 RepID=UPI0039EE783C